MTAFIVIILDNKYHCYDMSQQKMSKNILNNSNNCNNSR